MEICKKGNNVFEILKDLQLLIKKESSLKQLCKQLK